MQRVPRTGASSRGTLLRLLRMLQIRHTWIRLVVIFLTYFSSTLFAAAGNRLLH